MDTGLQGKRVLVTGGAGGIGTAISKALADTPENVVRKLKTLKKQKMDEAKLRTQAENRLQKMRKEKSNLEAEIEQQKATLKDVAKLLGQVKAMRETCLQAEATIKSLSDIRSVGKNPG